MCARMDKTKAVAAAAHKLARLSYTMLIKCDEYTDHGQAYCKERYRQRVLRQLSLRASKLGTQLVASPSLFERRLVYQALEGCFLRAVAQPCVQVEVKCVRVNQPRCCLRTNIVIDDKLMAATLRATGIKTKREVVELGLKTLLRLRQQTELRKLEGKYEWEGDLDAMRREK